MLLGNAKQAWRSAGAHLKKKVVTCIRQPSQGPTFGIKGSARRALRKSASDDIATIHGFDQFSNPAVQRRWGCRRWLCTGELSFAPMQAVMSRSCVSSVLASDKLSSNVPVPGSCLQRLSDGQGRRKDLGSCAKSSAA